MTLFSLHQDSLAAALSGNLMALCEHFGPVVSSRSLTSYEDVIAALHENYSGLALRKVRNLREDVEEYREAPLRVSFFIAYLRTCLEDIREHRVVW